MGDSPFMMEKLGEPAKKVFVLSHITVEKEKKDGNMVETIVQEVLGLQNCITPLLNGENRFKSWKYPTTLASQVVIQDSLAALSKGSIKDHVQGLELLVDRLVLVLELAIAVLDKQYEGQQFVGESASISTIVQTFLLLLNQQHYTSSQGAAQEANLHLNTVTDSEKANGSAESNPDDSTRNSASGPTLRNRNTLRNPLQNSQDTVLNGEANVNNKRKPCPTCGLKKTHRSKKLTKHVCSICEKEFRLRKYLTLHLKTEHKEDCEEKEPDDDADEIDEEVESLGAIGMEEQECTMCDMKFLEPRNLRRHVRSKHKNPPVVPKKSKVSKIEPEMNGYFKCPECNKLLKTERNLRKHSQIHSRNFTYTCETCGKGYYNIGSYRAHKSTHTGEKYFICKQCGKGFAHSSTYNFHIRTAHTTEQKFECELCNRKYKSEKYLKEHFRSVHDQPDRYNCTICSRTFGHRASLFMHMKTHPKNKEYSSEIAKQPEVTPSDSPAVVSAPHERDERPLYKQLRSYVDPENVSQGLMNSSACITVTPLPTEVNFQQQQPNYINCNFMNSEPVKELTNGSATNVTEMHLVLPPQPQDKYIAQPACSVSYSAPPASSVYPTFPWGGREREFGFAPNNTGIARSLPPVSLPPMVTTAGNSTLHLPSLPSQYAYTTGTLPSATVLPSIYPPIPPHETNSVSVTNPSSG